MKQRGTAVVLPYGSKRAITMAIDNYIQALHGQEINPHPHARPKVLAKMIRIRKELVKAKVVNP
jgi:hypothetical protein